MTESGVDIMTGFGTAKLIFVYGGLALVLVGLALWARTRQRTQNVGGSSDSELDTPRRNA